MSVETKLVKHVFLTWSEWVAYCQSENIIDKSHLSEDSSGNDFYGSTWSEACRKATEGIDATSILEQIEFTETALQSVPSESEVIPDVYGLTFDVGLVVSGEPECWFRQEPEEVEKPVRKVRIILNNCASAGVSKEVIEARGIAAFSLALILDRLGVYTELWVVYGGSSGNTQYEFHVLLKRYADHPDYRIASYAISDVSAFRRLGFAAFHHYVSTSQVYPAPVKPEVDLEGVTTVYLDRMYLGETQWQDKASVLEWTLKQMSTFGVEIPQFESQ